MQFDFTFSQPRGPGHARPDDEVPFRILVLGDFSGRGARGVCDPQGLGTRPILKLDLDTFDQAISRLAPAVRLQAGADAPVEFRSLDDFHPDRLYRDLAIFRGMRDTRARLLDPATFAETAARLQPARTESPDTAVANQRAEDDSAMLGRLLGSTPAAAPAAATPQATAIDALIRRVVAPHIVPDAPPFQDQYVASVDAAAAELLRAILHDPGLQALESVWRGMRWLVSTLELGEQLELQLLDVSRAELDADATAADNAPERMALYRRLVEEPGRGIGGERWSLLVGLYDFTLAADDARLLGMLGAIAAHAGGPILAAADSSLLGCQSLHADPRDWSLADDEGARSWQLLRASALAPWIGLALPRVLLRLPYGRNTEPVSALEFEEYAATDGHEAYLWGNPALACALLLGQSFLDRAWEMEPGDRLDIGDLPAHIVEIYGEKRMQACAEVFLSERAGTAILERGIMPLMSYRNRNAARLLRMQSLAQPARPLAGPWA